MINLENTSVADGPALATSQATKKHLRGSTLLLSGRVIAMAVNFVVQILIVRYLSKSDYGAFAYALSLTSLGSSLAVFGLEKTVTRFIPMYQERGEYQKVFGSILMIVSTVFSLGFFLVLLVFGLRGWIAESVVSDPLAVQLLLLLIFLTPIQAMDSLLVGMLAIFSKPTSIFFRRYVLGPSLRLLVVLLVILFQGDVYFLSMGFIVGGALGIIIYYGILIHDLRKQEAWKHFSIQNLKFPVKDILGFSVPLFTSSFVFMLRTHLVVVLLEYFRSTLDVAAYRAVQPVADLNTTVIQSFGLLFMPTMARMYARNAHEEIDTLYWQSAVWITVISFPIFLLTFSLAQPLTLLLFGERYAQSGSIMAILAIGYYFNAALGFNADTLRVHGKLRYTILIDFVSLFIGLGLNLILIPRYGAIGAAIGTCATLVLYNILNHLGLKFITNINLFEWRYLRVYSSIILGTLVLAIFQRWLALPIYIGVLFAGIISLVILFINRDVLNIEYTFPELLRFRFVQVLFKTHRQSQNIELGVEERNTKKSQGLKIAYIMSRFPKLTETFILYEMLAMRQQGIQVEVYPLLREYEDVMHPEAAQFVNAAHFQPFISLAILQANLYFLWKKPLVYLQTLWDVLRANWGSFSYFTGVIGIFPKTVFFAQQMRTDEVQHVHAHFASHPAAAGFIIHRLVGIPYSFTAHGSDLHRDRHMLREKVSEAAFVITISKYNKKLIISECLGNFHEKVNVVHCGVDTTVFQARSHHTPYEKGEKPFMILCIGTLHEVKGQAYLIEACRQLQERGRSFECHFVGDGPDKESLIGLVQQAGILDKVYFHGRLTRDEIAGLLITADVLTAPSVPTRDGRREGIPIVLMEAMGSAVPVIASDLSGIPELVNNQLTGLLVPPRDATSLAFALERYFADPELRRRLGCAGREKVIVEFDLHQNATTLAEYFRKEKQ